MAFQRFIYCFGPIAFPPSDHAQLLVGLLAFHAEIDLDGFLDPEAAHLHIYFLHLFSFFSYQAFVLNSPRVLGLSTLALPRKYLPGCNLICYQWPNLNRDNLILIRSA